MLLRALAPLCALLLAACGEPPSFGDSGNSGASINPGPGCGDACAAGFRWAAEQKFSDPVKCRGESEYSRGCREAIAALQPFGH